MIDLAPPIHAKIQGKILTDMPKDLYIPPEALEIFLEQFEGPLDLLCYLIRKQNLDILNLPIADITQQYLRYIELMQEMQFELAAEYLLMAAMLAEIKSRLLLPKEEKIETQEEDPRTELIRKLQAYEICKEAANKLDTLNQVGRDIFIAKVDIPNLSLEKTWQKITLPDLFSAFQSLLLKANLRLAHRVITEPLSVRERMTRILSLINPSEFTAFFHFFDASEGKKGIVVTFLAILELFREGAIDVIQPNASNEIYLKAAA